MKIIISTLLNVFLCISFCFSQGGGNSTPSGAYPVKFFDDPNMAVYQSSYTPKVYAAPVIPGDPDLYYYEESIKIGYYIDDKNWWVDPGNDNSGPNKYFLIYFTYKTPSDPSSDFNYYKDNYMDGFCKTDAMPNDANQFAYLINFYLKNPDVNSESGDEIMCTKVGYEVYEYDPTLTVDPTHPVKGKLVWPLDDVKNHEFTFTDYTKPFNDLIPKGILKPNMGYYFRFKNINHDNTKSYHPNYLMCSINKLGEANDLLNNGYSSFISGSGVWNNDDLQNSLNLMNLGGNTFYKNEAAYHLALYQNTKNATFEKGELPFEKKSVMQSCGGSYWYKFQAPYSFIKYYINTMHCLTTTDTKINVYKSSNPSASDFSDLTLIASNDDYSSDKRSYIKLENTPTKNYFSDGDYIYVQVYTKGNSGTFFLNILPGLPKLELSSYNYDNTFQNEKITGIMKLKYSGNLHPSLQALIPTLFKGNFLDEHDFPGKNSFPTITNSAQQNNLYNFSYDAHNGLRIVISDALLFYGIDTYIGEMQDFKCFKITDPTYIKKR